MPFNHRIDSIDFLRGLAIIAVILLHINLIIPFNKSAIGQLFAPALYKIVFWSGYYGVIIFFVISGFLITTSSIKRWGSLKNVKYDQFYLIRFARIMPCLIGLLIILALLDRMGIEGFVIDPEQASLGQAVFSALTFNLNWLEAKTGYLPAAWNVLWSLSVEEMFYLFFPLICRGVKKDLHFILLMLLFIILGPFARTLFTSNEIWIDHSYLSCMDGIALGCLAGLVACKVKFSKLNLLILQYSGIALTLLIVVFRKQVYDLGLTHIGLNVTILEIGMALLLIALYQKSITTDRRKNYLAMPFQWFGRNSYEIYLTHVFFVIIFTSIFTATNQSFDSVAFWYIAIIATSGIGGQLISNYYSTPINKALRSNFLKCI